MGRHSEADLRQLKLIPVAERPTRVSVEDFGTVGDGREARALLARLPRQLAAERLRAAVDAVVRARQGGRPVVVLAGAHVIKVGASPWLAAWIERGVCTHLALHGAGAIHDLEIALFGNTSEDVGENLHRGTFGLVRETGAFFARAASEAAAREEGLGEALGRALIESQAPHAGASLLAAAHRAGIPATVHVALGTDTVHAHPDVDGAAVGAATLRDFRVLAHTLREARGAVIANWGSAVLLPEVLLKALSVAVHLGARLDDLTTIDVDQIPHYRPRVNVVERPTRAPGARGLTLTGHHEILLPLLAEAVLAELGAAAATPPAPAERPLQEKG